MMRLVVFGCATACFVAIAMAACGGFSGTAQTNPDAANSEDAAAFDGTTPPTDGGATPDATIPIDSGPFVCFDGGCFLTTALDHPQAISNNTATVYVSEAVADGNIVAIAKDGSKTGPIFHGDVLTGLQTTPVATYFLETGANLVHILGSTTTATSPSATFLAADDAGVFVATLGDSFSYFDETLALQKAVTESNIVVGGIAITANYFYATYPANSLVQQFQRPGFTGGATFNPSGYTFALPTAIFATDDAAVYVAEVGRGTVSQLTGENLNAAPIPIASNLTSPSAIVVDAENLYVADAAGLWKFGLLSHEPQFLAAVLNVRALSQDDEFVYCASEGASTGDGGIAANTGYVARVAK